MKISRFATEHLLPARRCPCCGQVTTADAPPGAHPGSISYGPGINTAAVLLSGYGNVPAERTAHLIGMLLGVPVSPGFVHKAASRLDDRLHDAGFDAAMQAALAAEPALGADETPVNVLTPDEDPETGEPDGGSPHVLIIRPPGGKLTWLRALGSRRAAAITPILGFFTGFLITDGYTAYQQMLPKLAGIQRCAAHVVRPCRAVTKLGPGSLQSWAGDVIEILREAHGATEEARARGEPAADAELLAKLRQRYDQAVAFGITHNRHWDWHDGSHPGYALGCWLRDYAGQVWLFTREPAVDWTNNVSERGAKAAKRHQAVSGYWHTQTTLARWCRIRSYLDSASAHAHRPRRRHLCPQRRTLAAAARHLNPQITGTHEWTRKHVAALHSLVNGITQLSVGNYDPFLRGLPERGSSRPPWQKMLYRLSIPAILIGSALYLVLRG